MAPALRRLRRDLLRLAARAARERWPVGRLEREIDRVIAGAALDGRPSVRSSGDSGADLSADVADATSAEQFGRDAAALHARLTTQTASPAAQADAAEVLRTAGRGVTRLKGQLRQRLADELARVLRSNGTVAEAEAVVRRRTRQADHAVRAVAQTAVAQFNRAFTMAGDAPDQRYRYDGPPADRDFCRDRLREAAEGVTYTREEMAGLSNGQGLDVALACGGYQCRHRWVAVRAVAPVPAPTPDDAPALPAYTEAERQADLATIQTPAIAASKDRYDFEQAIKLGRVSTDPMTAEEAFPVYLYTRAGIQPQNYRAVNRRLRDTARAGVPPGDEPPLPAGWTAAYERATNAALRALPAHSGEVWRKVDRARLPAAERALFDAEHVAGGIVEYGAFTSSSVRRSIADGFPGDVLCRIQSKTGRICRSVSSLQTEDEILFQTRTRFRVVDVSSVAGQTRITLEEL